MKPFRLVDDGKISAGTRDYGAQIRIRLENAMAGSDSVEVDLDKIEDMTPSFADECFGKISEELGEDVTIRRVNIINGDQFMPMIRAVVSIRLQRRRKMNAHRTS
jgi:hypothetical protein